MLLMLAPWPYKKEYHSGYKYWQNVYDLSDRTRQIMNDTNCYSSDKLFVACINGMNNLLSVEFHQELGFDGDTVAAKNRDESTVLKSWVGQKSLKKINFEKLLAETVAKIDPKEKNFAYGMAINGFLGIYKDPHTYILPIEQFNETINAVDPRGLGFVIAKSEKGQFFFKKINKGSLFDIKGVVKGDVVTKVNDKVTKHLSLSDIYYTLKNSTNFEFEVMRDKKQYAFNFKKEDISASEVNYDSFPNYSVITINKFAKTTCEKVESFVNKAMEAKVTNIVLDLRENPGGTMSSAECIGNLFLPKNTLLYSTKTFAKEESREVFCTKDSIYKDNLYVLVDRGSASSSELLAGSLQANKRAVIIGQTTLGKGSFQNGENWQRGLAMFETQGLFILPSGKSPQLYGVTPDFVTKSTSVEDLTEQMFYSPIDPGDLSNETVAPKVVVFNAKDEELAAVEFLIKNALSKAKEELF